MSLLQKKKEILSRQRNFKNFTIQKLNSIGSLISGKFTLKVLLNFKLNSCLWLLNHVFIYINPTILLNHFSYRDVYEV